MIHHDSTVIVELISDTEPELPPGFELQMSHIASLGHMYFTYHVQLEDYIRWLVRLEHGTLKGFHVTSGDSSPGIDDGIYAGQGIPGREGNGS